MLAEREFQKLDMVSSYNTTVEPIKFYLKLALGIFMAAVSLLMVIHWFSYMALQVDGKHVWPFLNDYLEKIEQSPAGFLATVFFVLIGFYFVAVTVRGNVKFGLRFFFVSFYPVVPRETFMNAFFANCLALNIWMAALIHFMNIMFRGYLRGTQIAKIFMV